jgi:cytochrome b561
MDQRTHDEINAATRVEAGDGRIAYDAVARSLHWATVFLVLANFALALTWEDVARPTRHLMQDVHMTFGILLGAAVIARIVWRLVPGHRPPPAAAGLQGLAARGLHALLYILLLAEFGLGFVLRWSGGEAMIFFGAAIPSPMAEVSRATHHQIAELHEWNGWAIIVLAAGHAGAALYHHFVLKDGVLRRMLPGIGPGMRPQ